MTFYRLRLAAIPLLLGTATAALLFTWACDTEHGRTRHLARFVAALRVGALSPDQARELLRRDFDEATLIGWLRHPVATVRRDAADALALVGTARALPALIDAIADQSIATRAATAARHIWMRHPDPDRRRRLRDALLLRAHGRNADALRELRSLTADTPDWAHAFYELALTLIALGRPADAVRTLEHAIRAQPLHFDAWAALGETRFALGDWDGATDALTHALRLNPRLHHLRPLLDEAARRAAVAHARRSDLL